MMIFLRIFEWYWSDGCACCEDCRYFFDFNGSWLPGLHRFVGSNKVLLVGNKADLIPKSVKAEKKVIHWMKYSAKQLGLKPEDVFF
ncbi:hypothetical protein GCM10020331_038150 [Ectobacillus funiculus]